MDTVITGTIKGFSVSNLAPSGATYSGIDFIHSDGRQEWLSAKFMGPKSHYLFENAFNDEKPVTLYMKGKNGGYIYAVKTEEGHSYEPYPKDFGYFAGGLLLFVGILTCLTPIGWLFMPLGLVILICTALRGHCYSEADVKGVPRKSSGWGVEALANDRMPG